MTIAYLQNKNAQYFTIGLDSKVTLVDKKTPLQEVPEKMKSIGKIDYDHRLYKKYDQIGFRFRGEGARIVGYVFFTQGIEGDCILTLEGGENICGDLDFTTCQVHAGKYVEISCVIF